MALLCTAASLCNQDLTISLIRGTFFSHQLVNNTQKTWHIPTNNVALSHCSFTKATQFAQCLRFMWRIQRVYIQFLSKKWIKSFTEKTTIDRPASLRTRTGRHSFANYLIFRFQKNITLTTNTAVIQESYMTEVVVVTEALDNQHIDVSFCFIKRIVKSSTNWCFLF